MIMNNKILAVALVAVLIGASVGAIAMRAGGSARESTPVANSSTTSDSTNPADTRDASYSNASNNEMTGQPVPAEFKTTEEQNAYKIGFAEGFQAAKETRKSGAVRSAGMTSRNASSSRRVYYDYSQKHGRTFFQKHRDKLTMAMGSGGGALVGALIGGKKGAGIGALAGLGGSALYTYKLRNRNHR